MFYFRTLFLLFFSLFLQSSLYAASENSKVLAYIVSDLKIPFWSIMEKGLVEKANQLGYEVKVYSSGNSAKSELQNSLKAINNKVDGIIISPTNSSACVTILQFAKNANIPVVIADIGTDEGEYVSYISSNNKQGAYAIGKILANYLREKDWQGGRVGIIAIPQKRFNGQQRTAGFLKALDEENIKSAAIKQQVDFSYEETYKLTKELLQTIPDLKAIWLQGSDKYKGAQDALKEVDKLQEIALLCFDAEPEFIDMIKNKELVVVGMQQPYLMGQEAVIAINRHLLGEVVARNIELPVLAIHSYNIDEKLSVIKKYVLGID